jgi:O-6-methylguanine DNA methyltransferase
MSPGLLISCLDRLLDRYLTRGQTRWHEIRNSGENKMTPRDLQRRGSTPTSSRQARQVITKSPNSQFTVRVLSVVRRIPPGKVATYGDVAAAAGRPRAWRAVGNIMRDCRAPDVPCHRVIAAAGRLGGYGGNIELKRSLLRAEGLLVSASRIRDFTLRRWKPTAGRRTRTGRLRPT